jgi:hypothetical protein
LVTVAPSRELVSSVRSAVLISPQFAATSSLLKVDFRRWKLAGGEAGYGLHRDGAAQANGGNPMSRKITSVLAASVAVVALGSFGPAGAAAAERGRHRVDATHRAHTTYPRHHRHFVRRDLPPFYGYAGAPAGARVEPGYVFVPGYGILGEDCNMPTSTCTNEYRDVR